MVAGLGGLGVAGAAALLAPGQAGAAPARSVAPAHGPSPTDKTENAPPAGLDPIASAPLTGYTYRFIDMWDFTPENFVSGRAWTSAGGVYTPVGSGDTLWATAELPAGAVLGDVEWYLAATTDTELLGRLWVAGTPTLMKPVCDGVMPGSSTFGLVRAKRLVPSSATNGPYPHGTKLALGVFTPSDASVAVNGARIGFKTAPTGTTLLPTPVRLYDSRSSSPIGSSQTRTHSLASRLPVGATGAVLTVTAVGALGSGYLKVYSSSVAAPATSSLNFTKGTAVANSVQTAVSSTRSLKVTCGGGYSVHYVLDLVGYLV